MSYDFHKLKTHSFANGEVVLRIPERWGVWPEEGTDGYWGCYEKDADGREPDTGTLWIQVDHFDFRGEGKPSAEMTDMRKLAEGAAAKESPNGAPPIESVILPVDMGYRWHSVYDAEEGGEPLRFWSSHFFLNRGLCTAIYAFNFVLTHAQMDDPEFVELREIVEREIDAAFLDPFRVFDEENLEHHFGPLGIMNFDNQVKLTLPEAMKIRPHELVPDDPTNDWYCRLNHGNSYASIIVTTKDMELRDEDDGTAVSVAPEHYTSVLESLLDDPRGPRETLRLPQGAISEEIYDDHADADDRNGDEDGHFLHNHFWQYIHFDEGKARRLFVLLMMPLAEKEDPAYQAFIAYLRRAVRRATFPGFEEVEAY